MSEKIPARFRKTKSDTWAVMAPVEDLEQALAGDGKIEVLKRAGDWSTFTVRSLGRPFDVDGVKMCYGYAEEASDEAGPDDPGASSPAGSGARPSRGQSGTDSGRRPSGGGRPGGSSGQASAPPRDDFEPLPEYQGGPEDEWQGY